ncbi:MFS transporter [Chitinophaga varians]|uniref:MFS transporter n=1 Tax=Chitinophaga varians TaxID=2202339 RepID=UPI00165F5701|nr:MFS transporter [Chitinophaga varians]
MKNKERISVRFITPLVLGTMMNPLNSTMLATALTTICQSFGRNISDGALLITPLYLTSTIGQPLMGRLADLYSPKKVNQLGFLLVLLAGITGTVAPTFDWLIVSRVLLGLGTSAAYPSAIALVNRKYAEAGEPVPGGVLGIIAVSGLGSMVLGPVLGGLLSQTFGWKGIFFINIPWVLISLWLARALPDTPATVPVSIRELPQKLDIMGILLFSGMLLNLLLLLLHRSFSPGGTLLLVVLLLLLILWERRQASPFIDVRLFVQQPSLLLVYLSAMATSYVMYLMLFSLPQWMESVKQISPARTGLLLLPMSLVSAAAGLLISRHNSLLVKNVAGIGCMIVACMALFFVHASMPMYLLIGITVLVGLSTGINPIANQAWLHEEAPAGRTGVSFGLYRTFGYIGAIVSGSQMKTLYHQGVTDSSFHTVVWFTTASCVLMVLLLLPTIGRKRELSLR